MIYTELVDEYVQTRQAWIKTEISYYTFICPKSDGYITLFYKENPIGEIILWSDISKEVLRISGIQIRGIPNDHNDDRSDYGYYLAFETDTHTVYRLKFTDKR